MRPVSPAERRRQRRPRLPDVAVDVGHDPLPVKRRDRHRPPQHPQHQVVAVPQERRPRRRGRHEPADPAGPERRHRVVVVARPAQRIERHPIPRAMERIRRPVHARPHHPRQRRQRVRPRDRPRHRPRQRKPTPMLFRIRPHRRDDSAEVSMADRAARLGPVVMQQRQQNPDQRRQQRDDHQQLRQRETAASRSAMARRLAHTDQFTPGSALGPTPRRATIAAARPAHYR